MAQKETKQGTISTSASNPDAVLDLVKALRSAGISDANIMSALAPLLLQHIGVKPKEHGPGDDGGDLDVVLKRFTKKGGYSLR
jgi:hypothetical protein